MSTIDEIMGSTLTSQLTDETVVPDVPQEQPVESFKKPNDLFIYDQPSSLSMAPEEDQRLREYLDNKGKNERVQFLRQRYSGIEDKNAEIEDFGGVVDMLHLFSGIHSGLVAKQWQGIAAGLYKNQPVNMANLREKNKALRANSMLEAQIDELYAQRMSGNRSESLAIAIAELSKRVVGVEEFDRQLPTGFLNGQIENMTEAVSGQYANTIMSMQGMTQGATGVAGALAVAGIAAMVVGGAPVIAVGGAVATVTGLTPLLFKAGAMTGSYLKQRRAMAGAAYRSMFERMMAEGLPIDESEMKFAANMNGSLQAGVSVVEDMILLAGAAPFGLSKKVMNTIASPRYIDFMGKAMFKRLASTPLITGKEIAMELIEETVSYGITEMYMNAQGSETAWSMTKEEMIETVKMVALDTAYNTLAMKAGGDTIGLVTDSSRHFNTQRKNGATSFLSTTRKALLGKLPSNYSPDQVNVATGEVNQEQLDTDGQILFEAYMDDKGISDYMSPAQKTILQKFITQNPDDVIASNALETSTGHKMSELDGMLDQKQVKLTDKENAEIRFNKRLNYANPSITVDQEPAIISNEHGEVAVGITTAYEGYTITLGNLGKEAVIEVTTTKTGALKIGNITSTFNTNNDLRNVFNSVLPNAIMFDGEKSKISKLNKRAVALRTKYDKAVAKGVTAQELKKLENSIVKLQEEITAVGGVETQQPKGVEKKSKRKVVKEEIVTEVIDAEEAITTPDETNTEAVAAVEEALIEEPVEAPKEKSSIQIYLEKDLEKLKKENETIADDADSKDYYLATIKIREDQIALQIETEREVDNLVAAVDEAVEASEKEYTEEDIPALQEKIDTLKEFQGEAEKKNQNASLAGREPSVDADTIQSDIDALEEKLNGLTAEPEVKEDSTVVMYLRKQLNALEELLNDDLLEEEDISRINKSIKIKKKSISDQQKTDKEVDAMINDPESKGLAYEDPLSTRSELYQNIEMWQYELQRLKEEKIIFDAKQEFEEDIDWESQEGKDYLYLEEKIENGEKILKKYNKNEELTSVVSETKSGIEMVVAFESRVDTLELLIGKNPVKGTAFIEQLQKNLKDIDDTIAGLEEKTHQELTANTGNGHYLNNLYIARDKNAKAISRAKRVKHQTVIISDESAVKITKIRSSEYKLNTIFENLQSVFSTHSKDKVHSDKKGNSRIVAIINDNMEELHPDTRAYFGETFSDQDYADFGALRADHHDALTIARTGSTDFVVPTHNAEDIETTLAELKRPVDIADPVADAQLGVKEDAYNEAHEEVKAEPEVKVEKKKRKKKVVKKKVSTATVEEDSEVFTPIDDPDRVANTYLAGEMTRELSDDAKALREYGKDLMNTVVNLALNITSPFYRDTVNQLFTKEKISMNNAFVNGEQNETVKGYYYTPQDFDEAMAALNTSLQGASIKKIERLYKDLLQTAKADAQIMSVDVGKGKIPFIKVKDQIKKEITEARGYGEKAKGLKVMYDSATAFHLLIEKIVGKQSLLYKTMFKDIHSADREKSRFTNPYLKKINKAMESLPDGQKTHEYYGEHVLTFNGIKINKELALSLMGHSRDPYNLKAIQSNGLEISIGDKIHRLGKEDASELVVRVAANPMTENDTYVMDLFSSVMDDMYAIGNPKHIEVFNKEMMQYPGFHFPVRYEDTRDQQALGSIGTNADYVRAVFASPDMFVRRENKRMVSLVPISQVLDSSIKSMTSFVFTDQAFSRAEVLINSPEIKKAISDKYHEDYVTYIQHGIKRWAGTSDKPTSAAKFIDATRRNFSASVLLANLELAVQQMFSLPLYATYTDYKYLALAAMKLSQDTKSVTTFLNAWSPLYANRGTDSGSLDIQKQVEHIQKGGYRRHSRNVQEVLRTPMKFMDKTAVTVGMYASMLKFQAEVENNSFSPVVKDALDIDDSLIASMTPEVVNQYATLFAEYVTERTQPNSSAAFTSELQTATPIGRILTMFGTFTNTTKDLMAINYEAMRRGDAHAGRTYRLALMNALFIVPALTAFFKVGRVALSDTLKGIPDKEKDPFMETFLKATVGNISGYWFMVRDVVPFLTGEQSDVSITIPIVEIVEGSVNGLNYLIKSNNKKYTKSQREEYAKKGTIMGTNAVFMATGIPVYFNNKYSQYLQRD